MPVLRCLEVGFGQEGEGGMIEELKKSAERVEKFFTEMPEQSSPEELCSLLSDARMVVKDWLNSRDVDSANAKLLEACEQLWPWLSEYIKEDQPLECSGSDGFKESLKHLESALTAARAQAEDDAMPVDGEWLRSIGFTHGTPEDEYFNIIRNAQLSVCCDDLSGPTSWCMRGQEFMRAFTTRGDVRRLLAALGVGVTRS